MKSNVRRPALAEMVVVGAGVVGSSIAFRLAQSGIGVTIIEARYPGSGTSSNTFAWLNSFNKNPLAYHQLNVRGIGEHRVLAEEVGSLDCLHLDGGMFWGSGERMIGERDKGEHNERATNLRGHLAAQVDSSRSRGYWIEEITPEEAMDLEPDLLIDRDTVDVVFRMPMEGWLEAAGLAHRLCTAGIRRYDLRLIEGVRVTDIAKSNGKLDGVRLSDGSSIAADMVINAAGPDAGQLAMSAGVVLPLERNVGVSFVTSSAPSQLRHVVHTPSVMLRPDSTTRVMIRQDSLDTTAAEDRSFDLDDPRCADVLEGAASVMPRLRHATIESVRVGIRPIPSDGLPAVGPDPNLSGLYHAVTHSGATLAAILGRLVCADVLGAKPPELELFRPARFESTAAPRVSHAGSEE